MSLQPGSWRAYSGGRQAPSCRHPFDRASAFACSRRCIVDGNSERAVERMTDVERKTIRQFALTLGAGAQRLHDRMVRDLSCSHDRGRRDLVVRPVRSRRALTPPRTALDVGEAYTFVALDEVESVGGHRSTSESATRRQHRRLHRRSPRPLRRHARDDVSDGFSPYMIGDRRELRVRASTTRRRSRTTEAARRRDDHRYEPPRDPSSRRGGLRRAGSSITPRPAYIERNNGTMRHHIGRMRRLCYAFSKKLENHQRRRRALLQALQLLPRGEDVAGDSGDGRWRDRPRLGSGRVHGGGPARRAEQEAHRAAAGPPRADGARARAPWWPDPRRAAAAAAGTGSGSRSPACRPPAPRTTSSVW